jgi:5-methylcytosine-specific restriction endonuclease McrA
MPTALRSLCNSELLSRTRALVARERGLTIDVLLHLIEIEWRRLHLDRRPRLDVRLLHDRPGYSASAAKRRLCAARCIAQFPHALELLQKNEINLSTVLQVSRLLEPDTSEAVLERIRGKSQREVEAIVAEYDPLAAVPRERAKTVVVRIPAKPDAEDRRAADESPRATVSLPATDEAEIQDRNGPKAGSHRPSTMTFERRTVVQFAAREEVMSKLERVRALASHRLPINAPLEDVIEFLVDYFTEREDPRARHARREARTEQKSAEMTPKTSSARAIAARLRDEVFVRDGGQCCFVAADGKRCGSRHVLQVDHINPVARGGAATIENLRLLCAYHNRLEAERLMGRSTPS